MPMTTDAPGVFISYRRNESSHIAGRLYDRLVERLGEARVFMDVDSIKPGEDWTEAISRAVAQCGLMLVLIGHQWGQMRRGTARIDETDDPVRLEVEAAFDQGIPIIPVLLEDATMPRRADLPETLTKLSHLQAIRLRHESFKSDAAALLAVVQEVLGAYEKEGGSRRAHSLVKNILAPHDTAEVANPLSRARRLQADHTIGASRRSSARSGLPPEEPSPRPRRSLGRRLLVPLLLLISILALGSAAWILIPTTSTTPDQASGVETAEPVNSAVDAFFEGVEPETPAPRKPKAAGAVPGDTRGLYGGTRSKASCDAARLVDFLQTHPAKGAAWAGVLGMSVDQIPSFVAQLTPLTLRADTRVTNHGFVADHATTFPSILQAGTAVLVDKHGVPAVKCFCGNPLTPPRSDIPHPYQGDPWPGFDAKKVIVVKPAPSAVKSFTVVDHNTGRSFSKPTGVKVPSPKPVKTDEKVPVNSKTPTPESSSHSPSLTADAADSASQTPSVTPSTAEVSPTPSVTPSPDGSTLGQESASPTESVTTDHPDSGDSPARGESKETDQGTDTGQEGSKSQESSGNEQTEGNGTGKTGTDKMGDTGTNGDTGANRDTGTNGDTGTNRDTGTNGNPGGGATGSPGTG
jgi:Domain of unknown function (DUF6777)/TIR domain